MQAGKLDRRITIKRDSHRLGLPINHPDAEQEFDSFNEPVANPADSVTVWASKQDVRDAERRAAQEVGADITTRFQIRWSSDVADVDERDTIIFDDRTFSIVAVKELGRRDGLEITAVARSERV